MLNVLLTLLFAAVLGFVMFLIVYSARRFAANAGRQLEVRFRALHEIINEDSVPESWIDDFRRRITALRRQGAAEKRIDRLGRRAKRHCLKRIRLLQDFLEQGNYYESLETKLMILETMRDRQHRWKAGSWQELVDVSPAAGNDTPILEGTGDSGRPTT